MIKRRGLSGRRLSQSEEEFDQLLKLVKEQNITSYLEIGARHGDSFYEIACKMPEGSTVVAIDLPGEAWGIASSQTSLRNAVDRLREMNYDAHVFFADSTSKEAIEFAKRFANYDLVFIDGDHRYKGVKKDYENYSQFAERYIAFHDIAEVAYNERHHVTCEVKTLWDEIKNTHRSYVEHIEWLEEGTMGIGILEI